MAVAFKIRKADDVITGTLKSSVIPDDTATAALDHYYRETTDTRADEVKSAGFWYGDSGNPRWKWVTDDAAEQTDPRRRAGFFTMGDVLLSATQEFVVGDTDKTFKVAVLVGDTGEVIDTGVSGLRTFQLSDGTWVAATLVSGEATLTLKCDKPKELHVPDQGNLNFINNMHCRIMADATL